MKKQELEEKKLALNDDDGPGQIVLESRAFIPPITIRGQEHDYMLVFCDGAWLHFPISEPDKWWRFVPIAWESVTVEFGAKERGIVNRVPKVKQIIKFT